MIYTVTFNPSLDYILSVKDFQMGRTNRTRQEQLLPGGKGINVSTVLTNLGIENTALGFTAGFSGEEIRRRVEALGVRSDFIPLEEGYSRINVKLKDFDGTEINGRGPDIPGEQLERLLDQLNQLAEGDGLVLAGSIPESLPDSIYRDILERLKGRDILTAVDATGELLVKVLPYRPFLVKPNNHELGEIFGERLSRREDVAPCARKLQEMGARNVLVSMAGEGAVLLDEEGAVHALPAPEGKLVNAVGAGDSMVAGFLAGWLQKKDYEHAFRMGIAAGSASAFSENLAEKQDVERVYRQLGETR